MILLDTHVLIWGAEDNRRLGEAARATIEEARYSDRAGVSAITPWEIALLVERGRLQLAMELGAWIRTVFQAPGIDLVPIEPAIAIDSVRLPGSFHADPADRLIIATARRWGAPLLTADTAILAYGAEGHVQAIDAAR